MAYRAPAKINLTLEVLARRDDGFHGIRSVMVPLDLADELVVEPSDRFSFACDRAELSGDESGFVSAGAATNDGDARHTRHCVGTRLTFGAWPFTPPTAATSTRRRCSCGNDWPFQSQWQQNWNHEYSWHYKHYS